MNADFINSELRRLSRLKMDRWNETDVRESFITPLLRLLGYLRETDYDINHEGVHLLNRRYQRVGRDNIRIDYKLVVRKKSFWLIEAKSPGDSIPDADVDQAYLYATHPEVRARYSVVCNGRITAVYDTREPDQPILSITTPDLPKRFGELNSILGSQAILPQLYDRLISDLRDVLGAEILEDRARAMAARVSGVFTEMHPVIRQNAVNVFRARFEEEQADWRDIAASATRPIEIAVILQGATSLNDFNVAFASVLKLLEKETSAQRLQLFEGIRGLLSQRLRSVYRMTLLRLLIRLRRHEVFEAARKQVDETIVSEIKSALNGFEDRPALHVAWKLEGALFRVVYKSGYTDSQLLQTLEAMVAGKAAVISDEERVYRPPTLEGERVNMAHRAGVVLFDQIAREPSNVADEALSKLSSAEATISDAFWRAVGGPKAQFNIYGRYDESFDFMRTLLFHVLATEFDLVKDLFDEEMLAATTRLLDKICDSYGLTGIEHFWTRWAWSKNQIEWNSHSPVAFGPTLEGIFVHRQAAPPPLRVRIWGNLNETEVAEVIALLDLTNGRLVVEAARPLQ